MNSGCNHVYVQAAGVRVQAAATCIWATPVCPGDSRLEDDVIGLLRQMLTEETRALQAARTPTA